MPDLPNFICTAETPWHEGLSLKDYNKFIHQDAEYDDRCDSDYYDCFICPNCGTEFKLELAE